MDGDDDVLLKCSNLISVRVVYEKEQNADRDAEEGVVCGGVSPPQKIF